MNIELGLEIINSYKRLSYKAWYALAEFIDNSTQSFYNNKTELEPLLKIKGQLFTVEIEANSDEKGEFIRIIDNSIGMSKNVLNDAIIIGKPPIDKSGRSKYGLGMKTAACWLGDYWTISTKTIGEKIEHRIIFDVPKVAGGNRDSQYTEVINEDVESHYTIIEIRNLNRNIRAARTAGRIKNYLMSMYRIDVEEGLNLIWQGEKLDWNRKAFNEARLLKRADGSLEKEAFTFTVRNKIVKGWAGVFEKGSRKDAGFSIIQSKRVIVGWPDSFRPTTIFGPQEGGSNDLVNQRLVGELYMDGFEVSHTKDEILYENDELDELESKLLDSCDKLRKLSLSFRKYQADERQPTVDQCYEAINEFEVELNSNEIKDFLATYEIPSQKLIKESNATVKDSVIMRINPTIKAKIGEIEVWLYVVEDMSPYEPYVIIESTSSKSMVIVIVNKAHPHWKFLTGSESILNFLRHCTYDGVAEWKAYFKAGRLDPDTIKLIKDNLLRIPFEIQSNKAV